MCPRPLTVRKQGICSVTLKVILLGPVLITIKTIRGSLTNLKSACNSASIGKSQPSTSGVKRSGSTPESQLPTFLMKVTCLQSSNLTPSHLPSHFPVGHHHYLVKVRFTLIICILLLLLKPRGWTYSALMFLTIRVVSSLHHQVLYSIII